LVTFLVAVQENKRVPFILSDVRQVSCWTTFILIQ